MNSAFKYGLYAKSQLVFVMSLKALLYSMVWIIQGKGPSHTVAKIMTHFYFLLIRYSVYDFICKF